MRHRKDHRKLSRTRRRKRCCGTCDRLFSMSGSRPACQGQGGAAAGGAADHVRQAGRRGCTAARGSFRHASSRDPQALRDDRPLVHGASGRLHPHPPARPAPRRRGRNGLPRAGEVGGAARGRTQGSGSGRGRRKAGGREPARAKKPPEKAVPRPPTKRRSAEAWAAAEAGPAARRGWPRRRRSGPG
jgi:hypothetical protein